MDAIATLAHERASQGRDHALALAIMELEASDFPAGFDQMVEIMAELQKEFLDPRSAELAEVWMDRWLQVDTPGALQFFSDPSSFAKLPIPDMAGWGMGFHAQSGFGGVIRALARREPEWTRQMLAQMEPGSRREVGIYALLAEVSKGGVAYAKPFLASFSAKADRNGAMEGYVAGLVGSDIHSGLEVALAETSGTTRTEMLRLVFQGAAERGREVVDALLERIDDPAERRKQASYAVSAMGFEGREAFSFVVAESERRASSGDWKEGLNDWAGSVEVVARGPEARKLADWALRFPHDEERRLLTPIANAFGNHDPSGFQAWLSENAGELEGQALQSLVIALSYLPAERDESTRAWVGSLPPGSLRDQIQFQMALKAGENGTFEEAEAAYRSVAATDTEGRLARRFAEVMAARDPAIAARWMLTQPPGAARNAALEIVADTWSFNDPHGASQWLEQLPAGEERDRAVQSFAKNAAHTAPDIAAQWLEQITDARLRTETAKTVYERWIIQDPVAARAWLRDLSGVEDDLFTRMLRNSR